MPKHPDRERPSHHSTKLPELDPHFVKEFIVVIVLLGVNLSQSGPGNTQPLGTLRAEDDETLDASCSVDIDRSVVFQTSIRIISPIFMVGTSLNT